MGMQWLSHIVYALFDIQNIVRPFVLTCNIVIINAEYVITF